METCNLLFHWRDESDSRKAAVQLPQGGDHMSFYQSGNGKNKKGGGGIVNRAELQCYWYKKFEGNYANECPYTVEEAECLKSKGHLRIGGSDKQTETSSMHVGDGDDARDNGASDTRQ